MDEKEKKELLHKILDVDNDPKGSRVAVTVFTNKATREEGLVFMDYLDHHNPAVKKAARQILGHLGIVDAVDPLIKEFFTIIGSLTFMPDEEYKESHYFANIVEILETVFNIIKSEELKNDDFFAKLDEIFKRTKSEDLRFSMIKLLAILGDRIEYFQEIYGDLTEKERRALYYVYTFVKDPRRLKIFELGLEDDANFDYVVINMLSFAEGKESLSQQLLNMGSYNKQAVLKKLQEGKYPEFNDTLIKLLSDKNKYLVEMSIENLKRTISAGESLQPFIDMIESGYSPEGIQGALEIVHHFNKKNPEDIFLNGLDKQPAHKNKTIILDFLIGKLKKEITITEELSDKILPRILAYFDSYSKEKEELFISIFKIVVTLQYPNTGKAKAVKLKLVKFKNEFDLRLSDTFRNNFGEFMVKLNHVISRLEEAEAKLKNIVVLFDIDPHKIDHDRMIKLKEQVTELAEDIDRTTFERLVEFLSKLVSEPKLDWKVKTVALDLLAQHGGIKEIAVLTKAMENETSLAVKTNAQKALKKIEERNADKILNVLVMEPLFYLQKVLNEFFKSQAYRVYNLADASRFHDVTKMDFKYVVVSETLFDSDLTQDLFDYVDGQLDSTLVIITAKMDKWSEYHDISNIKFLKKPFNPESLSEFLETLQ